MRQAEIYLNGIMAGKLTETDDGKYIFEYDSIYCSNPKILPSASLCPKVNDVMNHTPYSLSSPTCFRKAATRPCNAEP